MYVKYCSDIEQCLTPESFARGGIADDIPQLHTKKKAIQRCDLLMVQESNKSILHIHEIITFALSMRLSVSMKGLFLSRLNWTVAPNLISPSYRHHHQRHQHSRDMIHCRSMQANHHCIRLRYNCKSWRSKRSCFEATRLHHVDRRDLVCP